MHFKCWLFILLKLQGAENTLRLKLIYYNFKIEHEIVREKELAFVYQLLFKIFVFERCEASKDVDDAAN